MRRFGFLSLLALVLLAPPAPVFGTTLDYQGYGFETGGFPPSTPGDVLQIPIVVNAITPLLGVDFETEEVTGWITGLVSTGPQDGGDATTFFTFSTGRIEIWRDPSRDHDFGTGPPNSTAPPTFTNGELCLAGDVTDFVLYLDTDTNTGAYEGNVVFDTGSCLEALNAIRAEGFTFGGVLTRQSSGGNTAPDGYDMSVDGFLEAQKILAPDDGCAFDCFALESAKLDFPRRTPRNFGPKDGKFIIEGGFAPCGDDSTELDPGNVEVRLRIGDYVQIFPEGSLRSRDRDHDDEQTSWRFRNERGVQTITEFEIEREKGSWEFEISGRGIPRSTLLGDDNLLVIELAIGDQTEELQVTLVQKKHYLRYKNRDKPCGKDEDDLHIQPEPGIVAALPDETILVASPNPFNATTTVSLRLAADGPAQLRIFDIRGRLVRVLHSGPLSRGEHRFHWNGLDEQGRGVPSGVYVYRFDALGIALSNKLVVAK